jgi:hypothetical protein
VSCTIVLVHGPFAESADWEGAPVHPILEAAALRVAA